jgi:uncharacterized protein (DUF4415 family)
MKKPFDYEEYSRTHAPDPAEIRRGTAARRSRRAATKQRITIRLDEDILEEFKALVPEGRGYQALINTALREWLAARDLRQLIREDLREVVREAVREGRDLAARTP